MLTYKILKKQANDVGVIPFHLIEFIKNNESKVIKVDSFVWNNASNKLLKYIEENWIIIKTSIEIN